MNTTYFLSLAAGNLFGTQKTPAIPEKYYIGLSSTTPNLDPRLMQGMPAKNSTH